MEEKIFIATIFLEEAELGGKALATPTNGMQPQEMSPKEIWFLDQIKLQP